MAGSQANQAHAAIETVIRLESARLIAGLARYAGGDIGLAEELAQDAVVAALEQWPRDGVPANPGAWLMTVAKRRAVDMFRRNRELERKYSEIGRDLESADDDGTADFDRAITDDIDDDLLRLIFTACHPVLAVQARVALTLRLLGGLTGGGTGWGWLLVLALGAVSAVYGILQAAMSTDLKRLLAALDKDHSFAGRRDAAVVRTFLSTEARLSESATLRYAPDDPTTHDVDLDARVARVMGKGRRERLVPLSVSAVKALDRYERVRREHEFLVHAFVPHMETEQETLHPVMERLLRERTPRIPMTHAHTEIRGLIDSLGALGEPAGVEGTAWLVETRRALYELFALLKVHLAEEEHYLAVLEGSLSPEERDALAQSLDHAMAQPI